MALGHGRYATEGPGARSYSDHRHALSPTSVQVGMALSRRAFLVAGCVGCAAAGRAHGAVRHRCRLGGGAGLARARTLASRSSSLRQPYPRVANFRDRAAPREATGDRHDDRQRGGGGAVGTADGRQGRRAFGNGTCGCLALDAARALRGAHDDHDHSATCYRSSPHHLERGSRCVEPAVQAPPLARCQGNLSSRA